MLYILNRINSLGDIVNVGMNYACKLGRHYTYVYFFLY